MKHRHALVCWIVVLTCLIAGIALGERLPADGVRLTRTQVLFEIDPVPGAEGYLVQVAMDVGDDTFGSPVAEERTETLTARVGKLRFGDSYRWRYAPIDASGGIGAFSSSFRFTILEVRENIDREHFRVRVRGPETPPGVFLLDYARVAVDGTGRPVWFLPENEELMPSRDQVRDLKFSPAGTLTLLTRGDALEMDLEANVLWSAPREFSPGPGERGGFHHDFKRLPDGHYMVLVQKPVPRDVPDEVDPITLHYDGLNEYNAQGELVWSWRARDYISDIDLFATKPFRGMHMNAFDVDPEGQFVLAGFRDQSRIIKIDRRTRKVVDSWGERRPSGEARAGEGFFWNQHDCDLADDGTITVYNNNKVTDPDAPSGIVRFDPGGNGEPPRVVWRWEVPASEGDARKARAGGNVSLIPGGYLLNMGAVNHLYLISPEGRVRWEALIDQRTPIVEGAPPRDEKLQALPYLAGGSWDAGVTGSGTPGEWIAFPQYRVSWSSSLWPIWFTAEERATVRGGRQVRVYNEGTEPDSYLVTTAEGRKTRTETVMAGTWAEVDLGSDTGVVTVRSQADPARVRSVPALQAPSGLE